jgi:glycosyltransferase involved in cell wall biosynthesis
MSALRVLHVTPDLVPYGLENMIAGLVRTLDREAFSPAVVSLYAESPGGLEPELRASGIPVFHLDKKRGLDVRMFPRLMRVVREFRPHILHTHNYVLRYCWPVARIARIPAVVHTIHNVAEREVDGVGRLLQSLAFRQGVAAVTIGDEVSASFRRTYGFAEAALIPNAIDVERYAVPAIPGAAWRRAEGIAEDEFVYLSVARFAQQKDHETLLRAFAQGPATLAGTRLLLAGDGELRSEIERRVEQLGLGRRVTFLGRRTDMPETLAGADVFVLSSRWEGNPLSVMEAMAAGRPVAATRVGAIPELVRDGVDGLLSGPGDAAALAHSLCAMRQMATAPIQAMGRAAAARAEERFGLRAMTGAYAELYRRALPGARRSAETSEQILARTTL